MGGTTTFHRVLERARADLLDLTGRNRLLNTPRHRTRSKSLEIIDELSEEIFRILVDEQKTMAFLPISGELAEIKDNEELDKDDLFVGLAQPDEPVDERGVAQRHTDRYLQTSLTSEKLQKRLLGIFYDARTYEEEQGVNILFLALGFLKWFEDDSSDRERYAPLLLVPMALERESAMERFKIRWRGEEISTNLSLQAKVKEDFGIDLPYVPDSDDLSPSAYFQDVASAVASQTRWEICSDDIYLGFFSFAKFLMYRDLDPDNWPGEKTLESHPLISGLLGEGFASESPLFDDDQKLDPVLAPQDMIHVMDADSSQTVAIEEVRQGRNLIIQGPPGTGKSQTITNLMATAIKERKKVLFVAEKMAALEVVKRRLENIGLGDICLELHSHKANKRYVLEDLAKTLQLSRPVVDQLEEHIDRLTNTRDGLNKHADMMHTKLKPSGLTPYTIIGELVRLARKGIKLPSFKLEGSSEWDQSGFSYRQALLRELETRIEEFGTPGDHPWRGVCVSVLLPNDLRQLAEKVKELVELLEQIGRVGERFRGILKSDARDSSLYLDQLALLGESITAVPDIDKRSLGHECWDNQAEQISEILETGDSLAKQERFLADLIADVAWTTDVSPARRAITAHGKSLFRVFRSDYRDGIATLRGILVEKPPKTVEERLKILDALIRRRSAKQTLSENQQIGTDAFGSNWRGDRSDWQHLREIFNWIEEISTETAPKGLNQTLSKLENFDELGELSQDIRERLPRIDSLVAEVFDELELDLDIGFSAETTFEISLKELESRFRDWLSDTEAATKWIAFCQQWKEATELDLSDIPDQIFDGTLPAQDIVPTFRLAYFDQLMRKAAKANPNLGSFDGKIHQKLLKTFADLDLKRIELARHEVALFHYNSIPRGAAGAGELGLIKREIQKKRRHLPLRKLIAQAGTAIQKIKPVFMMSPMSVAQFLAPGTLDFDLLLIDEASQVQPVDALGAIARSKKIVVVGDDKQLPPTPFFARGTTNGDEEDEVLSAGDLESILGLCSAQGMPERMLRWHYRSKHHSLIAVSNHQFYGDRLFVVPSPYSSDESLGVQFQLVHGVYDRGKSATNRKEAQILAQEVIDHARNHPNLTLGIGAFSIRQRDAILDELERLWREEPDVRDFFAPGKPEPFFVKNLENIQGDERDVIFLSVGYGRDESGFMSMSFGPLSSEGGERRLNVLISRARQRCKVFSSITADDIDLSRATGKGAAALKAFLNYAQNGILGVAMSTDRDYDSPFEEEVARAIQKHGYEVDPQVGVAGFLVDLAIKDPERPGRYILGIECDGAAYHSSRSARDRDRLRQQVLEDNNWIIHRIWSADWFHRPEEQTKRTVAAIEAAKSTLATRDTAESSPGFEKIEHATSSLSAEADILRKTGSEDHSMDTLSTAQPYQIADFEVPLRTEPHEVSVCKMAQIVAEIVEREGPIHEEEVARRVSSLWGLKRTGARIRKAVLRGIKSAERKPTIIRSKKFLMKDGMTEIAVRDRSEVESSSLKKPEMLPPLEIREALRQVVEQQVGVTKEEGARLASRLFGFKSMSSQLQAVIQAEIDKMVKQGELVNENGSFYLPREQA